MNQRISDYFKNPKVFMKTNIETIQVENCIIHRIKKIFFLEDYKEPKEMMNEFYFKYPKAEGFPMNRISERNCGKIVLLNTLWNEKLDVTNLKRRIIFENYLGGKK